MRVQQENRPLGTDGIDPSAEATFFKLTEVRRLDSADATRYLIETLAGPDIFEEVRMRPAVAARVVSPDGPIGRGYATSPVSVPRSSYR